MLRGHSNSFQPETLHDIDAAVDAIVARTGPRIVLATPLGTGKPNTLLNALYRRVKMDPSLHLKIFTALSLLRPSAHSDLERRFLEPFAVRVFGDYPDLDYAVDLRAGRLAANVEVFEFFMKTGDYLGNPPAQQHFIYSNYTHAARDMRLQGVNLVVQAVALDESQPEARCSLGSNPDLTLDLLDQYQRAGAAPPLMVGAVNQRMPFMENDAEVPAALFDLLVDDARCTHDLFAAPNMKVDAAEYAIALWASSLVPDAGTLQIGIGALGDGIAQALVTRDQHNVDYRQMLGALRAATGALLPDGGELGRFEQGLYGCSEMFVSGFLRLIDAGILRREVYDDLALQRLVSSGRIGAQVTPQTLLELVRAGRIGTELSADDVAWLKRHGIFNERVQWQGGALSIGEQRMPASLESGAQFEQLCSACLGTRLAGHVLHGGFFLGPRDFYQRLRDMPPLERRRINMTRVGFINQLYGHDELAQLQRVGARLINTTMMVTLLGAAVSDGLENGERLSGVGGQYNFVAMGHALPDARSILMLRATREKHGEITSNIVWNYGHTTIPAHLRDIVVTEYGVADLRGQTDAEVVKRLVCIADSRFQDELLATAQAQGKVEPGYVLPPERRNNRPEAIRAGLAPWLGTTLLPDYPLGCDFTDDECVIVDALGRLQHEADHPLALLRLLLDKAQGREESAGQQRESAERYLERMGLDHVQGLKSRLLRALFIDNL
ncbi:MAG: acetyl-CoA hydrolase [Proteobacteria bacterium]|nr:acetyl-CoA hydrolase [Pseudomonadota bacterium]